jgi:CcmD family protein
MQGQASGTPFLFAGYLITWAVLVWYIWRLNRRSRDAHRALDSAAPVPRADPERE